SDVMLTKVRRWAAVAVAAVVTVGGTWGAFRAARAEEPAPRFAAAMPRGALGVWLKSPTRDRYFQSASYRSFKRSRLYVKLQERLTDLQKGFGVEITD